MSNSVKKGTGERWEETRRMKGRVGKDGTREGDPVCICTVKIVT